MSDELIYTEENKSEIFGFLEDFLHNLFKKSDNETKANLSSIEWVVYIGTLLFVLIMPFLYSRLTTENFLTPKEFFSRISLGILGGIFCCRLFGAGLFNKEVALSKTSLDMPLVLFFGFCALSVMWNYNGISAIRDLRCVFTIMLLFPIIVNVFRSRWQVELLLWVVVFTGIATATIGFMETYNLYFKFDAGGIHYVKEQVLAKNYDPNGYYLPLFPQLASPDYAMGSVVSTFGNRNYLGTFVMLVAFGPLAFFFYYKNTFMKVFSLGLFGWLLYGLYITRCRAALIGLAVGFLYMVIMTLINDKGFKLIKRYGMLAGIVVVFFVGGLVVSAVTIKSESMWDKIKLTFTLDRLVSNTYERMWVWYGNNQAFKENPFTVLAGQGFGSFKHFFPLRESTVFSDNNKESFTAVTFRQAHNDWLQIFSELGIIGMILFLFLIKRVFGSIQDSLRRDIFTRKEDGMNGDHILIVALGAAIVSQLFAAMPDFPFHRIETAVFAVVFLSLIPVLTETNFFKSPLKRIPIQGIKSPLCMFLVLVSGFGAFANFIHEQRCWAADTNVREAETLMTYRSNDILYMLKARDLLLEAIALDPLPGDPYNKLAAWYEQNTNQNTYTYLTNLYNGINSKKLDQQAIGVLRQLFNNEAGLANKISVLLDELKKGPKIAFDYADKAWKNINFNARSTYHSVVFRKMHVYYHLLQDYPKAFEEAKNGIKMTAGDARSIYYLYAGKIAADLSRSQGLEKYGYNTADMAKDAEKYLTKLLKFEQFKVQAQATLAILFSQIGNWAKAFESSSEVVQRVPNDPTMQNILGLSAFNLGRTDTAVNALTEAIRLNPGNPVYHRDIGLVYKRLNRYSEAKEHFEKAAASTNSSEALRAEVLKELESLKNSQYQLQEYNKYGQ
jgi:O-antigen ligase/tetratricopeptide (TPR) repeat protein